MQTLTTLKMLAVLDRCQIEKSVRAMYKARIDRDVEACLACFMPGIVFEIVSVTGAHGFNGRKVGIEALRRTIQTIDTELELQDIQILDVLVDAERVAVRRRVTMRGRGSGVTRVVESFDYIRMDRGLITEMQQFLDTAAVNVAIGRTQSTVV